jgi:SAM-dependent methyltransferase
VSGLLFTGERLHSGSALFAIDIVRHRAAYAYAIAMAQAETSQRILDLGCGTGYGTSELAEALPQTFAVDRISPDARARHPRAAFIRADAAHLPLRPQVFDMVVSFQVIEHLQDPAPYLRAIAGLLRPGGVALLTTPNLLESDRENPFHVHEYEADELTALLRGHFGQVEMLGVSARPEPKAYYDARLQRIRSIVRMDPFGLRRRLPRRVVNGLFASLAVVVRRGIQRTEGLPAVELEDFPIQPAQPDCLDLLAVCRRPLPGPAHGDEGA